MYDSNSRGRRHVNVEFGVGVRRSYGMDDITPVRLLLQFRSGIFCRSKGLQSHSLTVSARVFLQMMFGP